MTNIDYIANAVSSSHKSQIGLLRGAFQTLMFWQARARQRRQLAKLEGHLLNDIGISRSQADAETAKPRWEA